MTYVKNIIYSVLSFFPGKGIVSSTIQLQMLFTELVPQHGWAEITRIGEVRIIALYENADDRWGKECEEEGKEMSVRMVVRKGRKRRE